MDIVTTYKSLCYSCECHPSWHTTDGECHFDDVNKSRVRFGNCKGCKGYRPSDSLELLEYLDDHKNS